MVFRRHHRAARQLAVRLPPEREIRIFEQGTEVRPLDVVRPREARRREKGRVQVQPVRERPADGAPGKARPGRDERDLQRPLVEGRLERESVVPQRVAVVRREDNQRRILQAPLLQLREELPDPAVHQGDRGVVALPHAANLFRRHPGVIREIQQIVPEKTE